MLRVPKRPSIIIPTETNYYTRMRNEQTRETTHTKHAHNGRMLSKLALSLRSGIRVLPKVTNIVGQPSQANHTRRKSSTSAGGKRTEKRKGKKKTAPEGAAFFTQEKPALHSDPFDTLPPTVVRTKTSCRYRHHPTSLAAPATDVANLLTPSAQKLTNTCNTSAINSDDGSCLKCAINQL